MRRIVFTGLIIVVFISCTLFQTASASDCRIELAASQVGSDYVDVTVSVQSNPGFVAFMLRVHFDNKKLEPLYITKGSLLPDSGFSNNLSEDDLSSLSYVQAYFVSLFDIKGGGVLYTIRFRINEDADERFVFYLDSSSEMLKNNLENSNNPYDISFVSNIERFPITEEPVEIMFVNDNLSVLNGVCNGSIKGLILEGSDTIVQENNAIILTVYDSSHNLVYTRFGTVRALSQHFGQPFIISDIEIPVEEGSPLELKLFLWNSLGQMKPLAENDVRIINIQK